MAAAVGIAALWLAACGNQPSPPEVVAQLPSGVYVEQTQGESRYFIALTTKTDGTLVGNVSYLLHGQPSADFTFTATTQSGVATLKVTGGHLPSGYMITATYSHNQLVCGDCTSYLVLVHSNAECVFVYSRSGLT